MENKELGKIAISKKEKSKTSVTLFKEDYLKFKEICKLQNTDSSKVLRELIDDYIRNFEKKYELIKD